MLCQSFGMAQNKNPKKTKSLKYSRNSLYLKALNHLNSSIIFKQLDGIEDF